MKPISILAVMKQLDILPRTAREKDVCMRSKQELRRTMHLLTEQIEHFLVWKKTQTETIACKRRLMEELYAREAYQLIPAVMKKARKIHEASPLRDMQYCRDEYELEEMDLFITIILKNRNVADNMKQTVDALRQYTVSQLLRYYCSIANAQKVIKLVGNYPMMEMIKSYIPESNDINHYTIRVYYTLLKILEDERTEDYDELKRMIYQKDAFDGSEFRQLLGFLTNFCNRKIHQGNEQFIKEKFDLYKTGLERGVWTEDIRFSEHQFIQMISTALELNQLEWTDDFMEVYGDKLAPDLRENILNYGKALRAFQAGMYDEAQDFLNTIDTSIDFLFSI